MSFIKTIRMLIAATIVLSSGTCKPTNPGLLATDSSAPISSPTVFSLEPTATVKPTATREPTPTKDVFAIDIEKLNHSMESMEDLRINQDEFVVSPFDPSVNFEEFIEWYSHLCSLLGDFSKMQVNFSLNAISIDEGQINLWGLNGESMESKPLNFGVRIGGILYPTYIVVGEKGGNVQHPVTVIMIDVIGDGDFSAVEKAMKIITEGGGELNNVMVRLEKSLILPNVVDPLIDRGLNGKRVGDAGFVIGFGIIYFAP